MANTSGLNLKMPQDMRAAIDRAARGRYISAAAWVRIVVAEQLQTEGLLAAKPEDAR